MEYSCDIGSWEKGVVKVVNASSPQEALSNAAALCRGEDIVVQIREKKSGRCMYDYMNFFSIYK